MNKLRREHKRRVWWTASGIKGVPRGAGGFWDHAKINGRWRSRCQAWFLLDEVDGKIVTTKASHRVLLDE